MLNINHMINKFSYQFRNERHCKEIEKICDVEITKLGLTQDCRVMYVSNYEYITYLVQIITSNPLLLKSRNIALLESLISRKSSEELNIKHSDLRIILNVIDPKIDGYLKKANSLSMEQIEVLLPTVSAKSVDFRTLPVKKVQDGRNKDQKESDIFSAKSMTVSEVNFEEYMAAETKNLKSLIAKKREENKQYILDPESKKPIFGYQDTTPSAV